jgi:hypothetical protein
LGSKHDTIRIYVERLDEPIDRIKMHLDMAQAAIDTGMPDVFVGMSLGVATSGKIPKLGELGSYFDPTVLHILWSAKSIAQDLNCNYEFIDIKSGDILEIDDEFPPIRYVKIIGKHSVTLEEKKLPTPCCVIRDQQMELMSETDRSGGVSFPNIRGFFHKVTGLPDTGSGRGYSQRLQRRDGDGFGQRAQIRKEEAGLHDIDMSQLSQELQYALLHYVNYRRKGARESNKNLAKHEMSQISSESVTCPKCNKRFTPVGSMIKPDGSIQCGKCFTRFKK